MFMAVIFIITRGWKKHSCPSTEEWIQKMWFIYTMEYYSAIKKLLFFRKKYRIGMVKMSKHYFTKLETTLEGLERWIRG